jgi:hypothetical protein
MSLTQAIRDFFTSPKITRLPDGSTLQWVPDPEIDAVVSPCRTDTAAVQARWAIHNQRAKDAGCPCGQAATHVARLPIGNGAIYEAWTCAEHVGVNHWSGSGGSTMTPAWDRRSPCGSCVGACSTTTKIGSDRPHTWSCPTRPDPQDAAEPFGGSVVFFDSIESAERGRS